MGCFLACFGGAKDRKQRRRARKPLPTNNRVNQNYQPLQASPSPQKPILKEAADVSVPELKENQEPVSFSGCRKKVTFDLNVKKYEDVAVHEDVKDALEVEKAKEEVREEGKAQESEGKASPGSNYRYQNCESSDDEDVDDDDGGGEEYGDSDFDDEEDEVDVVGTEEESYDSFFSLPIDKEKEKEKQQQNCQEVDSPAPVSVSAKVGSARDRSQYVNSVLNPVKNLSQWKELKVRALPLKNHDKENINAELESKMKYPDKENSGTELETKVTGFSPKPTYKSNKSHNKTIDSNSTPNHSTKQEISVDASLSTWLASSESSPKDEGPQRSNSQWSNSSVSREDQPILGALTVEDLKQSSVTSSPRRSPSRSPDEIPILGTVGSYWSTRAQNADAKGIPNTTSKYREDKR